MKLLIRIAGNIGVKLNLAVGEINGVSPSFIPPTLILVLKNSMHSYLILKCVLSKSTFVT